MGEFYSLDEQFSLKGEWWVAAKPELGKKQGVLTFEPGTVVQLQLDGNSALSDERFRLIGGFPEKSYEVIKGETETADSVLLLENDTRSFNVFYPRLVLVNTYGEIPWSEPDEITFRRLRARFTHLEDWRGIVPFGEDREYDQHDNMREASLTYTAPESIIIPLNSLDVEIRFFPNSRWSVGRYEAGFKYRMYAEVVSKTPRHINWLMRQLNHVQDLLAFLIGEPISKRNLIARLDSSETVSEVGQIFHVFHSVPAPRPAKSVVLTPMNAIALGENLPKIVESWFRPDVIDMWEVIRDSYFGVLYGTIGVPRFQFIALTQVLEGYHRKKLGGQYLSKNQYKPIKATLVQAIPDYVTQEHKERMVDGLRYLYQFNQKKRFVQLLELIGERLQSVLGIEESHLKKIIANRNYFTHSEVSDKKLLFNEQELIIANTRLTHMVAALLLKEEMGISEEVVELHLSRRKDRRLL